MTPRQIGVIGAGTMGNGIAQTFAMAGYPVILQDISDQSLERGLGTIKKSLDRLVKRERITADAATAALEHVSTSTAISDLGDCDLVVEAIVENIEIKSKVLAQLDEICRDDAIFASNTSSISLTKLAAASRLSLIHI